MAITLQRAKRLRHTQTSAERQLWKILRNRKLAGYKFRRQVPFGPFIVDFYCSSARLVIELDGSSHAFMEDEDFLRDEYLRKKKGLRVVRFENHVLYESPDAVAQTIFDLFAEKAPVQSSVSR